MLLMLHMLLSSYQEIKPFWHIAMSLGVFPKVQKCMVRSVPNLIFEYLIVEEMNDIGDSMI